MTACLRRSLRYFERSGSAGRPRPLALTGTTFPACGPRSRKNSTSSIAPSRKSPLIESLQKCQEEQRQAYSQIDEALMAGGAKADQVSRMLEVAPRARAPLR